MKRRKRKKKQPETSFKKENAFTGRIIRDKVRMRASPSADSPVVKELNRGAMLVIVGEVDDFYAVKPPKDTKAYIYRTLVLDGVVEGKNVNVRLAPHLESPIIAQLNTGDTIEADISEKNTKWLEIAPPASTLFYVSSDFIEKIGDANFLATYETRKTDVNELLNSTYLLSEAELKKPFNEMESKKVVDNYEHLIHEYTDFPDQVSQAAAYLTKFNDAYLHKKVEYLETKTKQTAELTHNNQKIALEELKNAQKNTFDIEEQLQRASQTQMASKIYKKWVSEKFASEIDAKMALWIPVEIAHYEEWAEKNGNRSIQDFYEEQKGHAVALRGVVESYDRPVRNKPGDYLLVNKTNRLPIAYVYSTHVNLNEKIGKEITVDAVLRPNNNFAYPAYFIIDAD